MCRNAKNAPAGDQNSNTKFSITIFWVKNKLWIFIYASLQKLESGNVGFLFFFQSSRGTTLSKIIGPEPNSNSTSIFLWTSIYQIKINMWNGCWENDREVNDDRMTGQKDGMSGWRNGVTIYAPATCISWQRRKNYKNKIQ